MHFKIFSLAAGHLADQREKRPDRGDRFGSFVLIQARDQRTQKMGERSRSERYLGGRTDSGSHTARQVGMRGAGVVGEGVPGQYD